MKYLFALNLSCDVYKKYPKIQLFADEKLIDEFHMDERFHDNVQWIDNTLFQKHCVQKSGAKFKTQLAVRNKQFLAYSLDDRDLGKKLTIKIFNRDSNYTNGFLTKSTLVYFGPIIFMPEYFLQDNAEKYLELWREYIESSSETSDKNIKYQPWPLVNHAVVNGKEQKLACSLDDPQGYDARGLKEHSAFGGDTVIDLNIDNKIFDFKVIQYNDLDDWFIGDWALDIHKSNALAPSINTDKKINLIMTPKIFALIEALNKNKYFE